MKQTYLKLKNPKQLTQKEKLLTIPAYRILSTLLVDVSVLFLILFFFAFSMIPIIPQSRKNQPSDQILF